MRSAASVACHSKHASAGSRALAEQCASRQLLKYLPVIPATASEVARNTGVRAPSSTGLPHMYQHTVPDFQQLARGFMADAVGGAADQDGFGCHALQQFY